MATKETVKSTITYGGKKFVCVGKRVKNKPRVFCALATKAKAAKKSRKRKHKVSSAEVARMRHRESYEAYMEGGLAGRRRRRRRRVLRRRAR